MKWLDSITSAMDMNLGKLLEMVRDREAWSAVLESMAQESNPSLLHCRQILY